MTPRLMHRLSHRARTAVVTVFVIALSVPAAAALSSGNAERPSLSGTDDTTSTTDTTVTTAVTVPEIDGVDEDGPGEISGPCDEAEHANDPRCTGTPTVVGDDRDRDRDGDRDDDNDDRSGPNRGSDDDRENDDHDRSGSNSGPG